MEVMEDEIERKPCGWAIFAAGKDAACGDKCPFERCLYDIVDDAMEDFWQVFNSAYRKYREP